MLALLRRNLAPVALLLHVVVLSASAAAVSKVGAPRGKSIVRREDQLNIILDSAGVAHAEYQGEQRVASEEDAQSMLEIMTNSTPITIGVPRLIHQTFRKKLELGHYPNPVWEKSAESWRKWFPEGEGAGQYRYQLWTDTELLTFYAANCEHEAGPLKADNYKNKISISDLGRYCLLWKLGGIYADLDYEPRANFYDQLASDRVSLVESPYGGETFQNSLMASPPGLDYWLQVLRQARVRLNKKSEGDANDMSGPRLMENVKATHDPNVVQHLSCRKFQRATHSGIDVTKGCGALDAQSVNEVLGIHWGTLSWRINGLTGSGRDRSPETTRLFAQLFSKLHPSDLAAKKDDKNNNGGRSRSSFEGALALLDKGSFENAADKNSETNKAAAEANRAADAVHQLFAEVQ